MLHLSTCNNKHCNQPIYINDPQGHSSQFAGRVSSKTRNLPAPLAIIEAHNFIALAGSRGDRRGVREGEAQFIRLKPAVYGNYQTKRTDNSPVRESLYINSFCSPNSHVSSQKGKVWRFFFQQSLVLGHLSFRNTPNSILSSFHTNSASTFVPPILCICDEFKLTKLPHAHAMLLFIYVLALLITYILNEPNS